MPEVGGIIVPEAEPGRLPNPHDPRVMQQFLMTALWRMAKAAGGTLVVELKDAMEVIPLSLSFVEQAGVKAAIITATDPPKGNLVAVNDPLGQLQERLKNGTAVPASALKR